MINITSESVIIKPFSELPDGLIFDGEEFSPFWSLSRQTYGKYFLNYDGHDMIVSYEIPEVLGNLLEAKYFEGVKDATKQHIVELLNEI